MTLPHVTLLYGGLLTLLTTALGMNVTRVRLVLKVGAEPGPLPRRLFTAIRAHGNAVEWTPLLVMMMLLVELSGGASSWLHVAGGTLFLGRALHALGFLTKAKTGVPGIALTWCVGLWLPGWALLLHF